jgi:vacuolar-type H+-ATPase subunit E/Vma4
MDSTLIKKHIKAVAKTYTEQEMGLPLTEKEEEQLTQKIIKILKIEDRSNVREVVHDVVYTFFTGQEDE